MHDSGEPDPGVGWMIALQGGDESAFGEIVQHYQEMVLNLIFKFMGTRRQAEDLSQEVFLRVFRARARYRPDARFRTWLYRIVFNLCVNQTKAGKRRATLSLYGDPEGDDAAGRLEDERQEEPIVEIQRAELAHRVRELVQALPQAQRMAVILNKYEGLSYREIAVAMNSTEKAVKSLLARARDKIKERLLPFVREGVT